jgi:CheY-like chemotaxis protein
MVLPALPTQGNEARPGPDAPAVAPTARGRILLVEDEQEVLRFVSSQLTSLGFEVTSASNGPDALALLRQDGACFDLLFSDVVLPKGMSGVELAARARELCPDLKVLLTSGYAEEVFEQHGRPPEGTPLLRKPYRRRELAAMVGGLLGD